MKWVSANGTVSALPVRSAVVSKIRRKESVALPSEPRPSRIRRDPVRLEVKIEPKPRSREREIWTAVAGVALVAAGCTALVVGVSQVTSADGSGAAAATPALPRFDHCQTARDTDCVFDGDSFVMDGQAVEIAGIDAPEIRGARCPGEARRGIQAAVRLRDLLNRGTLDVAAPARSADGRVTRKVEVNGRDVALTMTAAGVAREYRDGPRSWCSPAS